MMDTQPSVNKDAITAPALEELNEDFSTDENRDIVDDAKRVVSGLRSGVRAVIDACVLTATTCQRFPDSIDAFLDVLVAGNIISRAERRLGRASPKLSKLRTIGSHAELLNREEIFPHLVSGFTVLHQLTLLYKELPGDDEEARVEQLAEALKIQPELTMEFLKTQTNLAKEKKKSNTIAAPEAPSDSSAFAECLACTAGGAVESGPAKYDQVLLTPDFRDVRRLGDEYPEGADLPRCLRMLDRACFGCDTEGEPRLQVWGAIRRDRLRAQLSGALEEIPGQGPCVRNM